MINNEIKEKDKIESLKELPVHVLKEMLNEKEIQFKSNSTKEDLINCLETGEGNLKRRIQREAPILEKDNTKVKVVLPKGFDSKIERLHPDLAYSINETDNCIDFSSKIPGDNRFVRTSVNIDSGERVIYLSAINAITNHGNGLTIDEENRRQAFEIENRNKVAEVERQKVIDDILNGVV